MQQLLIDAFEYHHHYNERWVVAIQEHNDQLPKQVTELFSHVLNAHQIWNARILNTEAVSPFVVHPISAMAAFDTDNFNTSIRIVQTEDMNRVVGYTNSRNESYSNKVGDILFHVLNHATHHKGQIALLFRQAGLTPMITDYIFYKR